jgi:hypothetical protein
VRTTQKIKMGRQCTILERERERERANKIPHFLGQSESSNKDSSLCKDCKKHGEEEIK